MKPVTARPRRIPMRLLMATVLLWAGTGGLARAWNPYDTDSAAGRGDANPWSAAIPVAPATPGWSGQQSTSTGDAPMAGASPRWPDPGATGWDASAAPRGGDDAWAARERARYRFRGDSDLPAAAPGAEGATGYRYRPLTRNEQGRHSADDGLPRWRDDDLQPHGPSWGIEDAGSAVGYELGEPHQPGPVIDGWR